MIDKGDKSLENLESSQCNYSTGGLMFCVSPPARNNARRKENPGDGTHIGREGPVKDRIIREKDVVYAEKQQTKPDRLTEGKSKGEAFCISPPAPKRSTLNKGFCHDVNMPNIIEKLRNGRMNANQSSPRQPLKADHTISNGRQENEISSASLAGQNNNTEITKPGDGSEGHTNDIETTKPGDESEGQTNDTQTTKPGDKSEGQTNDTQTTKPGDESEGHTNDIETTQTPDQSTRDLQEPPNDSCTDGKDHDSSSIDNEKSSSHDEIIPEKERKEAQARFVQGRAKLFAQNLSVIQKLREQVNKAKEGISKMCEEEEDWKCRLEMQKGVVNANLKKIEHIKWEQPFWYSGAYGEEPTLEQLQSNLTESREDLIYQLSRVRKLTQDAVQEKVMERRRLGESYPKWLLPNFRKRYSHYSDKHGLNETLIKSVCPKLDIIVSIQKRPDNSRRYYKVLIDGRYFNYKKTGLTQVMGLMNEEMDIDGKLQLNVPIKTASTEITRVFRKPRNTNVIDVEFIQKNGCDESITSLIDERLSYLLEFSPSSKTSAADRGACVKGENEPLTDKSIPVHTQHPPPYPKRSQMDSKALKGNQNQNITQKANGNMLRVNYNEDGTKSSSANGAGENATYTSPLTAAYKQPKSLGYILFFDKNTSTPREMHLEQLSDNKPTKGQGYPDFEDGKSNNIVPPVGSNRSETNSTKHETKHNKDQLDPVRKVVGLPKSLAKKTRGDRVRSDSWQHGHSVLPPIGHSTAHQTTEEESSKYEINSTLCNKKVSIQFESDVIPVQVPHRSPLSSGVTYVMALVRKDTIIPLSLAQQGSLIPVRKNRFQVSVPKHDVLKNIEGRGQVEGAMKRGLAGSLAKKKCNETTGSRPWQRRHSFLPPIGKSTEHQRTEERSTKRVTNVKLNGKTISIACESNMIPVKLLHRAHPSSRVTYVVTLVRTDSIKPFSLTRQGSLIPIRPHYIQQDIRELRQSEYNQQMKQNVQNRRYLYTIQERSQEFDDECFGSPIDDVPLPFASYQDEQLNSPLECYEDIDPCSEAVEYEIFSTPDSPYGHEDNSLEIQREASIVSLGFTPGGDVYDGVNNEKCPKEDEKTSAKEYRRSEKDEELITDWTGFFSKRNSNDNCCKYRGPSVTAGTDGSTCNQVFQLRHTSAKKPATVSNSRRCQALVPHPPSTKRPAAAKNSRRSFVKVRALF